MANRFCLCRCLCNVFVVFVAVALEDEEDVNPRCGREEMFLVFVEVVADDADEDRKEHVIAAILSSDHVFVMCDEK